MNKITKNAAMYVFLIMLIIVAGMEVNNYNDRESKTHHENRLYLHKYVYIPGHQWVYVEIIDHESHAFRWVDEYGHRGFEDVANIEKVSDIPGATE